MKMYAFYMMIDVSSANMSLLGLVCVMPPGVYSIVLFLKESSGFSLRELYIRYWFVVSSAKLDIVLEINLE
jgi:hypothetical protein